MDLVQRVEQAFAPGGPLPGAVDQYRTRAGQLTMAAAVARTIESGGAIVVEAGTGVGKTYAYLVPALLAGAPTLISTATKALQDQLFSRDIPHLLRTLALPLRVVLLKGRSSYLCLHRLEQARHSPALQDADLASLSRIERWAPATATGDLAEVPGLDDTATWIPLVTSTRENCLGARCPQASSCHVSRARREAMAADVVVINHHLFFADCQVRETGVAELLPTVRTVVFDEAHQLHETGVQFLGAQVSTGQLDQLATDLERLGGEHAAGLAPWRLWAQNVAGLAARLRTCGAEQPPGRHVLQMARPPEAASATPMSTALGDSAVLLLQLAEGMRPLGEVNPELEALQRRVQAMGQDLQGLADELPLDHARWFDNTGRQLRVYQSPLDLAGSLGAWVNRSLGEGTKSWIFTSATLGHEPGLSWFVQACGLQAAQVMRVESPFDFSRQAALYVPQGMVSPQHPDHAAAVSELVALGAVALGGRTLVLTTTLRAMRQIGELLQQELPQRGIDVLVQGQGSKRGMIERFGAASDHSGRGAVLVASASFWEGIDLPGEALQLVVIDKLPFTPPDDPLQQARARQLELRGENPFRTLHLPMAAIALKQGAGRLIRREDDQGVLVVCDVRLLNKPYGRQLLQALPPMRRLDSFEQYREALQALTRPSTKGPCSDDLPW